MGICDSKNRRNVEAIRSKRSKAKTAPPLPINPPPKKFTNYGTRPYSYTFVPSSMHHGQHNHHCDDGHHYSHHHDTGHHDGGHHSAGDHGGGWDSSVGGGWDSGGGGDGGGGGDSGGGGDGGGGGGD